MLSLPILQGSHSGLDDPHSILLSASLANAFFAGADPVGQILRMDDSLRVKVTSVHEDQTKQYQMAWLKVMRYHRGWMKPADFAMIPGEPDA